jgi:hypothetical protein
MAIPTETSHIDAIALPDDAALRASSLRPATVSFHRWRVILLSLWAFSTRSQLGFPTMARTSRR